MDKQDALTPIQNLGFLISAIRCGVEFDEHCQRAADALRAHLTNPGYVRVPDEARRSNAPIELDVDEQLVWASGWNACRESMLAAAKDPHDCAKHGHLPIGWTGTVYCEICGAVIGTEGDRP